MVKNRIFELSCGAMNYEWGQVGRKSLVAQLLPYEEVNDSQFYAELWMGVHPKCPSHRKNGENELLSAILGKNPDLLGNYVQQRWGGLPFLFKILSIAKPLSIQAHPDRKLAEQLHANDPEHYPDSNHKPEVAIALSEMKILFGFDDESVVQSWINRFSSLMQAAVKQSNRIQVKISDSIEFNKIAELYAILSTLSKKDITRVLNELAAELEKVKHGDDKIELFLTQLDNYPGDIGLLLTFFMKHVTWSPGSGIFIGPQVLHAYLPGNLVECMANSDNVIRAGMTNKFKDLENLIKTITLQKRGEKASCEKIYSSFTTHYITPADEFEVHEIRLPEKKSLKCQNKGVPEILLVLLGNGRLESGDSAHELKKGTILFVGAYADYYLTAEIDMQILRGTVPLK